MPYRNPGHPTPCPHCPGPKTLPSEKAMVAHVRARHPSLAPFACLAGCGRFFKSKPGALKHSGTCKPPPPQHHRNGTATTTTTTTTTTSNTPAANDDRNEENASTPPPAASQPSFRATRKECPTCGAWLASAASLARHRRTTACGGRKRVWVGEGPDPRGTGDPSSSAAAAAAAMKHGNRWKRSWVVVDEGQDEDEVRGREPEAIAGKKRRFVEERRGPVEGEGPEGKRVRREPVKRAPRGKNKERAPEITAMMGVWGLEKGEGGREREKVRMQEEFKECVWNLQMQEATEDDIQEEAQKWENDEDEDDEEMVAIRFPVAGKRLPGTISPPRKTVAGKTVPGKTVSGKTVPGKTVPRKAVPRKTVPQRKDEEGETEDSETEESEVEVKEWEDESDDDGEESEWDEEDYM